MDKYPDYKIENLAFRVVDVTPKVLDPLLYETNDKHYEQGFTGFYTSYGTYYKGIDQILNEIEEHKKIDNWSISIDNHNNGGIVKIPEFLDEYER